MQWLVEESWEKATCWLCLLRDIRNTLNWPRVINFKIYSSSFLSKGHACMFKADNKYFIFIFCSFCLMLLVISENSLILSKNLKIYSKTWDQLRVLLIKLKPFSKFAHQEVYTYFWENKDDLFCVFICIVMMSFIFEEKGKNTWFFFKFELIKSKRSKI